MKKFIACIIISTFLAAALSGCGSNNDVKEDHTYTEKPVETATITPDTSIDVDDGIVNDRDGIIDDDYAVDNERDTAGTNRETAGNDGAVAASPVIPTQTTKP